MALFVGLGVGFVLLVGFVSCAALLVNRGDGTKSAAPGSSQSSSAKESGKPSSEPRQEDDAGADDPGLGTPGRTGKIGVHRITFMPINISVSISSATMESDAAGSYLLIKAKIQNRSTKSFDASAAYVSVATGPDEKPAKHITVAGRTHDSFGDTIAPKKSKTARFAFLVTKKQAKDLHIHFTPDSERLVSPAIFIGSAT